MAKSVAQLKREAQSNEVITKRIYNPDSKDFTHRFGGKDYTVRAREIEEFPYYIANHLKKHLAFHVLVKRGQVKQRDHYLPKIEEEIEVKI